MLGSGWNESTSHERPSVMEEEGEGAVEREGGREGGRERGREGGEGGRVCHSQSSPSLVFTLQSSVHEVPDDRSDGITPTT